MLTRGNFTRDEWNHLVCLFNISHFISAECSDVMSKRTQKDSGEERRVTAKSKPMMNLVSRCSERTPDVLSSTASESLGKTRHESQTPLSPQTEMCDRTGRPVVCAHSSSYSEWNIDKIWSSQEWKSDELMDERTERPVVSSQHADRFIIENDETNSYAEAESDLSLGSRAKLVTDVSVVWFSEIHHTSAHRQYCHVGNTAQQCRLGLFQDLEFAGDLKYSKSTSEGVLCIFGSRTFVPISSHVQETNFSVSQFHRIGNYFVGCWFEDGRATCSRFMERGDRSVTFIEEHRIAKPWGSKKLLQTQTQRKGEPRCWSTVKCGLRDHKRKFFSRRVSVVHLWR